MTDVLMSIIYIFHSSEISISWYLINAFFLPFFSCLSSLVEHRQKFFFLHFNFYFHIPVYREWEEPLQEAVVSPGLSNCHFCSTFPRSYCYPMIDTWIDASPISAPVSHPTTRTTSSARRAILTQRDEATNARNVAICIFQRIANPTRRISRSLPCVCPCEIRPDRRVVFFLT